MSDTQVLSGLVAKRGELAGQVEQSHREVQRLAEELSHLDATIRLFDPDYDVGAVEPRGHVPGNSGSPRANASVWFWKPCAMRSSRCRRAR